MSITGAYMRLGDALKGAISRDESMAKHTTYRIGGPVGLYIECATLSDLSTTSTVLAEEEVPCAVVGKGSNLLVSDEGFPGAVVTLTDEFTRMNFSAVEDEGQPEEGTAVPQEGSGANDIAKVTLGGGATLARVVQRAYRDSLSGLEFAVGIPGTVGGAIAMNAGSRTEWMGMLVDTVTTYVPGKGLVCRRGTDIAWGYRQTDIPRNEIIVETTLRLREGSTALIRQNMERRRRRRQHSQPLDLPSCGSVFRNPEGKSVAQLIDACGLAGETRGNAQISTKHANFIVNLGGASALDVLELIHLARGRVKETYGIELQPEVRFLGFSH